MSDTFSNFSRRHVLAGLAGSVGASCLTGLSANAMADSPQHRQGISPQKAESPQLTMKVAAESPWQTNAVALSSDGTMFLGLPRFNKGKETPSVAKVDKDGQVVPFPGGSWNEWRPGDDGRDSFVMVNALHIFDDDTLWVVDQGAAGGQTPAAGAQKLVRLDVHTGSILAVLRFGDHILPKGAQFNDLRIHDNMLYATDSGLGGIIVHDIVGNRTLRRLSKHPLLRASSKPLRGSGGRVLEDQQGKRPEVHSDVIELSVDGQWLYWATPPGPIRRIATAALTDTSLTDQQLGQMIETIIESPTLGGTAVDTLDNFYLSDVENRRITLVTPDGEHTVLAQDDRLISPDAIFITADRKLYVPAPQIEFLPQHHDGKDGTHAPFQILMTDLPEKVGSYPLGNAVTGKAPPRGLSNFHGIEHIAITVPDHDAAVRFLEQAFDATVLYSHVKKSNPLSGEQARKINAQPSDVDMLAASQMRFANGPNIEVFEMSRIGNNEDTSINDQGLVHFSVVVDDIKAAARQFESAGGKMWQDGPFDLGMNEEGSGNQNWFGQTPWGGWVEFMTFDSPLRYEPGTAASRWFPVKA